MCVGGECLTSAYHELIGGDPFQDEEVTVSTQFLNSTITHATTEASTREVRHFIPLTQHWLVS
jgi:hypothetical protein